MVSFKTLLTTLAMQALVASATPVQAGSTAGEVGILAEEGRIQYCTDKNWKGDCHVVGVPLNKCHNVPSKYNDKISSIQNMFRDTYKCWWYIQYNCEGKNYDNQKDANLGDGNGNFNDSISSYICLRK